MVEIACKAVLPVPAQTEPQFEWAGLAYEQAILWLLSWLLVATRLALFLCESGVGAARRPPRHSHKHLRSAEGSGQGLEELCS